MYTLQQFRNESHEFVPILVQLKTTALAGNSLIGAAVAIAHHVHFLISFNKQL